MKICDRNTCDSGILTNITRSKTQTPLSWFAVQQNQDLARPEPALRYSKSVVGTNNEFIQHAVQQIRVWSCQILIWCTANQDSGV